MTIPVRATLLAELHCLSHDGQVVITAQRWADRTAAAERPRSWLRLVRNGRPIQARQFTGRRAHRELEVHWAKLIEMYAPTALAEDQMWARLLEITGIKQVKCARDCPGRMPVAWPVCRVCGRHARRVAGGAMTGSRRRPELFLPAGVFERSDPA